MGLLSVGTPLSWEEAAKHVDHVRREGIKQFLNSYKLLRGHNPSFWSWGDEVHASPGTACEHP
jgi:glutamate--cysteine ligase catalytic subunit